VAAALEVPLERRPMIIRPLAAADGASYRHLRLEALERHPQAFWEGHAELSRDNVATVAERLAALAPPEAIFGAFVDAALVGSIGLGVERRAKVRHKGVIWGVYVTQAARRNGIARALVAHVLDHARQHVALVQLAVAVDNHAARRLYRQAGFETFGVERDALRVDGRSYDEELMALSF
jgi:ribosomal protein S18 acetylase RimI-like enzyme